MLWEATGQTLGIAMGVAITPIAIVSVIMFLLSDGGRAKGLLFLLGWAVPVFVFSSSAYLLTSAADDTADNGDGGGIDVLHLVLGLVFFLLAYMEWRQRPRRGQPRTEPKLVGRIDSMSPLGALALGAVELLITFKTYPLVISAGAVFSQSGVDGADAVTALILFTVVSSILIVLPAVVLIFGGSAVRRPFEEFKQWLVDNLTVILLVVFVILGANSIGHGLGILD